MGTAFAQRKVLGKRIKRLHDSIMASTTQRCNDLLDVEVSCR